MTQVASGTMEETAQVLTLEQLSERRQKTEAVSQFFLKQLRGYLEALRPLLTPARLLGRYVSPREDLAGAEKAAAQLKQTYDEVCGKPFALARGLEDGPLGAIENKIDLYPWEYAHEAAGTKEKKTLTVTSPVRWIMSYASAYTLSQLRSLLIGKGDREQATIRQFIVNALAMKMLIEKSPGIAQLLGDLRYQVTIEKSPVLGELPVVTIGAAVPSFRPSDELMLGAVRLSGVPAFIELIDVAAVRRLEDPLKRRIEEMLAG
jgi:hypothetical protein